MRRPQAISTSTSSPTTTPPINLPRSPDGWTGTPAFTCTTRRPRPSWMNLVERFFRDLTEFITEKSFASTRELADAIIAFLAARNQNPQRYVWKAKGEDILRKIDAVRQALAAFQPPSNAISETAH